MNLYLLKKQKNKKQKKNNEDQESRMLEGGSGDEQNKNQKLWKQSWLCQSVVWVGYILRESRRRRTKKVPAKKNTQKVRICVNCCHKRLNDKPADWSIRLGLSTAGCEWSGGNHQNQLQVCRMKQVTETRRASWQTTTDVNRMGGEITDKWKYKKWAKSKLWTSRHQF